MIPRRRKTNDDMPANEQESVADLFQWLLYMDELVELAGRPVNARYLAGALRDLTTASFSPNGTAHEVRLAWQMLYDVMGPKLLGKFVSTGAWKDFVPAVSLVNDTDSYATLWAGGGKKVVGRVQFQRDVPVDLRFDVE